MKPLTRSISLMMAIVLLISAITIIPAGADSPVGAATPRLNNTHMTSENFYINDDGVATIVIVYTGYQGVTDRAIVNIDLERKTLLWWSHVHSWTMGFNGWTNGTTETLELSKKGEYRVHIQYQVSGSGGEDDVFSFYMYDEY